MTITFDFGLIHFVYFGFWYNNHEDKALEMFDPAAIDKLIKIANFYEEQEATRALKLGLDEEPEDITEEELRELIQLKKL